MEEIPEKEAGAAVNRNEKAVIVSGSRRPIRARRKQGKHNIRNKRGGLLNNNGTPTENEKNPKPATRARSSLKKLKTVLQNIVRIDNPDLPYDKMSNAQRQELLASNDPPENRTANRKEENAITDESGGKQYSGERDDEWLGVDEEYKANTTQSASVQEDETNMLDQGCEEYMSTMKYFWWSLYLGGRMPFQTYTEDNIVKFKLNMHSLQFIYFAITSIFLTICTTTMGYSFFRIFFVPDYYELNFYEKVERLEVDKYWIFIVVTFSSSAIASCWSLATMFDDGAALAEFLARWNLAISVLKYRPVSNIRLYFWLNSSLFVLYVGFVVLMFTTDYMPIVRNASGLVGLTILRPFTEELRFSRSYPRVQRFGLFVHLYAVFSARCILHMAVLYCKLLVNCARKWNLRLAYVMGYLKRSGEKKNERIVAMISYQKLFTEHTIIVGFLRHTGKVFAVALGVYYTLKMLEFLIVLYHLFSLIVYPPLKFNETHVRDAPDYLEPIAYTDPRFATVMTALFLLAHGFLVWIMMTEQITSCGEALLDGFSFIRRCGLILSRSTQRQRFVLSFTNGFSSVTDYYVCAGYTINREFAYNVFFWLATFTGLLIAFHPFHLQKELITVCGPSGKCVSVTRTAIAWRTSWTGSGDSKQKTGELILRDIEAKEQELSTASISLSTLGATSTTSTMQSTITPTTTITTTTIAPTTTTIAPTTTTIAPTTTTIAPTTTASHHASTCSGEHDGRKVTVSLPKVCFKPSNDPVQLPSLQPYQGSVGFCPTETETKRREAYVQLNDFYSCEDKRKLNPANKRDHCGFPPLQNVVTKAPAVMKARKVFFKKRNEYYVICCYDYGFGEEEAQHCNQIFTNRDFDLRCDIELGAKNLDMPLRFIMLDMEIRDCLEYKTTPKKCEYIHECLCFKYNDEFHPNAREVNIDGTTVITCK